MSVREEKRRRDQALRDRLNQQDRGIEMFAPSGASMEYCVGVYATVSRRGRVIELRGTTPSEAVARGCKL